MTDHENSEFRNKWDLSDDLYKENLERLQKRQKEIRSAIRKKIRYEGILDNNDLQQIEWEVQEHAAMERWVIVEEELSTTEDE